MEILEIQSFEEYSDLSDRLLQLVTRQAENIQHLTNSAPDTVYDQVPRALGTGSPKPEATNKSAHC